ncbi:MAG TPA: hypothetical protein VHP31_05415 [Caproicibacter sp.]|nr:hypothetical protein [Caproicibacter sp.]
MPIAESAANVLSIRQEKDRRAQGCEKMVLASQCLGCWMVRPAKTENS